MWNQKMLLAIFLRIFFSGLDIYFRSKSGNFDTEPLSHLVPSGLSAGPMTAPRVNNT